MSKTWSLAALLLLAACQSAPAQQQPPKSLPAQAFQDEQAKSPVLGLEFWVNDAKSPMRTRAENGRDEVETQIGIGEFEVRFPARRTDVALRMIAWTDRTIFALKPGMKFGDVQFLRSRTDIEDERGGGLTLRLNPSAQNYYLGERVRLHAEDQEKVLFARIEERADLRADSVFVSAVIDVNDNSAVDVGEFECFRIRLVR